MLSIEDPPERPVCSSCMTPLVWIFPARTKRWVAMVAAPGMSLEVHICDQRDPRLPWKPNPEVAESAHRGNALARRVLRGDNPFIDEEKSA
jgi:hypothetical protein